MFMHLIKDAKDLNSKFEYNEAKVIIKSLIDNGLSKRQNIDACKLLCLIERKLGNYELAFNAIEKAVNEAKNIIDEMGTNDVDAYASAIETYAICLMNQGVIFDQQGMYVNAIPIYQKAKALFCQIHLRNPENPGILINCYFTLGMALLNNGDMFEARKLFEESLPLFDENFDGNKELDERYSTIMSILQLTDESIQ